MATTQTKNIKNGARLTNGSEDTLYQGTSRIETVTLGNAGTYLLRNIENVRGSSGNDVVTLLNPAQGVGSLNLGRGNDDELILAGAGTYRLRLDGVEQVRGVAGVTSALELHGAATFQTDGSLSLSTAAGDSRVQDITFTALTNSISLNLGGGADVVRLGSGFSLALNKGGELVLLKDGKSLTFKGYAPDNTALRILVNGLDTHYAALQNHESLGQLSGVMSAADLLQLQTPLDASAVTEINGTLADVLAVLEIEDIATGNFDSTLEEGTADATDLLELSTENGTGTVDASRLTAIDGTVENVLAVINDTGITTGNFDSTLGPGTADAADLQAILDGNGTGTVDASALTAIDGTSAAVAALVANDDITLPTTFDSILSGTFSVDDINEIDAANGEGIITYNGTSGDDTLDFTGVTGALVVNGLAGDDTLTGGSGADTLNGGEGNDTLTGGAGADTLNGGSGSNTYVFNTGDVVEDEVVTFNTAEGATETFRIDTSTDFTALNAGAQLAGLDVLNIASGQTATFDGTQLDGLTLTVNGVSDGAIEILQINGTDDTVTPDNLDLQGITTNNARVSIDLGDGDDRLQSPRGNTIITAGAGDDGLFLYSGDHLITDAGNGADSIYANGGPDVKITVQVTGADLVTVEGAGAGTTVNISDDINGQVDVSATIDDDFATVNGGSGDDTIRVVASSAIAPGVVINGGAGNDTITDASGTTGGYGDHIIDGGAGTDTMDFSLGGGDGDQVFLISAAAHHTTGEVIKGGQGTDEIRFTTTTAGETLTLSSQVDVEEARISDATGSMSGTIAASIDATNALSAIDLYGNDGNNTLTGNDQSNSLMGWAGIDTLNGKGGNDYLYGGNGDDILDGGAGDDLLEGGAGNDTLTGGSGDDLFSLKGVSTAADRDVVKDFSFIEADRVGLDASLTLVGTAVNNPAAFVGHAFSATNTGNTPTADYKMNLAGNTLDVIELNGLDPSRANLSGATDGSELLKMFYTTASVSEGTSITSLEFETDVALYLLAYDDGNAYLYRATGDSFVQASDITLVGTFENVTTGAFVEGDFVMV